jgi:EamA-like transporter family protein
MRRTGPSTAAILSTFEPVVTTGLAALTLKEFLTPVQLVGGLVVLSSAAVVHLRTPAREAAGPTQRSEVLAGAADTAARADHGLVSVAVGGDGDNGDGLGEPQRA